MKVVDRIKGIADKYDVPFKITKSHDKSYIDIKLGTNEAALWIGVPLQGGVYSAYDITSSALPSELYFEKIRNDFSLGERSEEIIANIDKILGKEFLFHESPTFLKKERGYFVMNVDGIPTKVYQKKNYFDLPVDVK